MKTIALDPLNPLSIQNALDELEKYKQFLIKQTTVFIDTMAEHGIEIAQVRFANAMYAGTNDVTLTKEPKGENMTAVVALGNATLFIEFGTGVHNPGSLSPESAQFPHGEYGYGLGKLESWTYKGDPGNMGIMLANGRVYTRGNPAQDCMYYTVQDLKRIIKSTAEEVFRYD